MVLGVSHCVDIIPEKEMRHSEVQPLVLGWVLWEQSLRQISPAHGLWRECFQEKLEMRCRKQKRKEEGARIPPGEV